MFLGTKGIDHNIRLVRSPRIMWKTHNTTSHILPNPMIGNVIMLILYGPKGNGSNGYHTLFFIHHLLFSINSNHKHSDLVVNFNSKLISYSHVYHIWDVGRFFMVIWRLLCHYIGDLSRNMITPLTDYLDIKSREYYELTKVAVPTGFISGSGMSGGIS